MTAITVAAAAAARRRVIPWSTGRRLHNHHCCGGGGGGGSRKAGFATAKTATEGATAVTAVPAAVAPAAGTAGSVTTVARKRIIPKPSEARSCQYSSRRYYTNKSSFSSLEYPLATEAPEITRTTAEEASKVSEEIDEEYRRYYDNRPFPVMDPEEDPFDEAKSLTVAERNEIIRQQKEWNETPGRLDLDGPYGAITADVPSNVPPNVSADQLEIPQAEITTLENGVRVVSQETYGQVSSVGIVCNVGSRYEIASKQETGITNLLEMCSFGSCREYSGSEITLKLQDWGGTRFCSTGREQTVYCLDVLRPNAAKAVDMLRAVTVGATFDEDPNKLEDAKRALEFQAEECPPEVALGEALQMAAFGSDQQLGQPHFCPTTELLPNFTPERVAAFWERQYVNNPEGIVVSGAGVSHQDLVDQVRDGFGHLRQGGGKDGDDAISGPTEMERSTYRGGWEYSYTPEVPAGGSTGMAIVPDEFVRVAVALPVGGWHSDDLVPACVLQTLLGGGNSFSAGGPGKGMYSRIYRQVLNRYTWAESAEAFTAFYHEGGLFGLSGSTTPDRVRDLVRVLSEHLARLATEPVSDEELSRAVNMLKCNVLTQLESRLVLFEDLGRQVLTYGHREDMHATCLKIEAVTAEDLRALMAKTVGSSTPVSVAAVGRASDENLVPSKETVESWIR